MNRCQCPIFLPFCSNQSQHRPHSRGQQRTHHSGYGHGHGHGYNREYKPGTDTVEYKFSGRAGTGRVGSGRRDLPPASSAAALLPPNVTPRELAQIGTHNHTMKIKNKFGQLGAQTGCFNAPHGFCMGANGEIVVADTYNHRIQIFSQDGKLLGHFGQAGKGEGCLWYPRKVLVLKPSGHYVVCDRGSERSRYGPKEEKWTRQLTGIRVIVSNYLKEDGQTKENLTCFQPNTPLL